MNTTTSLALRGIDTTADSSVRFRFAAGGKTYNWTFKAATLDELVALVLSGRLGKGKNVHFDGAKVSFQKSRVGASDTVTVAIGRKVRIVAPVSRARASGGDVKRAAAEAPARRPRVRKKSPAA